MNAIFSGAGKFTSREDWTHPILENKTIELIVVTEGDFELWENGNVYKLTEGDIIFLDADKVHKGVGISHERVSFYWLHFYFPNGERIDIKHLTLKEVYPVTLLCRQILHYAAQRHSQDVMNSLICVLLFEIDLQNVKKEPLDSLAERIVEWIRINSDKQLISSDVAERFGYNEDYITRLLKKEYGCGLKQMINNKRVEYIKYLLSESEVTLTEAAYKSGFADVKLFLKFFTYHEGITPTEYRRIYKTGHTNNR